MALNKGEWSEVYVFLKLLAEGRLYAADANLNKIKSIYYPVIKILKEESGEKLEYCINSAITLCNSEGKVLLKIPIQEFSKKSTLLLKRIQEIKGKKGSFAVDGIVTFLQSIKIAGFKAPSKEKKDITLVVHDMQTGMQPTLGFSIKSYLGSSSTLVNASQKTNFIFEIVGESSLNEREVARINAIVNTRAKADIKGRVHKLLEDGFCLKYHSMSDKSFEQNLVMIDSLFPNIIAFMLEVYYSGEATTVSEILSKVVEKNPCEYNLTTKHPFYEYKIKNYLTDAALGMTPGAKWSGKYDATGGYIIVREDGELVCYHIYNRNEFQEYLLQNTKLDTPSSSRNHFGYIYSKDNRQFLNLNLQVRFI